MKKKSVRKSFMTAGKAADVKDSLFYQDYTKDDDDTTARRRRAAGIELETVGNRSSNRTRKTKSLLSKGETPTISH